MGNILIIDDNKDLCDILTDNLVEVGYGARTLQCGEKVLDEVEKRTPDLILLDMQLPDTDGLTLLKQLKPHERNFVIIILTGYGNIKTAVKAMKLGASDYLTKPFKFDELLVVIKSALHNRKVVEDKNYQNSFTDNSKGPGAIIGANRKTKQILKQVKLIAPTNTTVLIQGESGVGKELIAQMIHQESPRCNMPFIPIDCGAIPETLMEGEFFGSTKGAYTGAYANKSGKFVQADKGTIFLDEISNLSSTAQAKLLRVLESRIIWPLGSDKGIDVDVRIVAATNINLLQKVENSNFREDLFYRLNEFSIQVPSLRERKDDISIIGTHFINIANAEFRKQVKEISDEAMELLINYNWPGNIRELKNIIKMSVLSAESNTIIADDLPASFVLHCNKRKQQSSLLARTEDCSFDNEVRKTEESVIRDALSRTGGSKSKASEFLQINRKALYRKMKRLGIN